MWQASYPGHILRKQAAFVGHWLHAHLFSTVLSALQAFSELTLSMGDHYHLPFADKAQSGEVTCPGSQSKQKAAEASKGSQVYFGLSIPCSQPRGCFGSLALDMSQSDIRSGAFTPASSYWAMLKN